MPATHRTVTSGAMSGESDHRPRNGNRKNNMVTPSSESTLAARTWPASFAGGDTSRTSSTGPTMKVRGAPGGVASGAERPEDDADRFRGPSEAGVELSELGRHGHAAQEPEVHREPPEHRLGPRVDPA